MFDRGIGKEAVIEVVTNGETIAEYPDDKPYPCKLILGFIGDTPLHVVLAEDNDTLTGIVVTTYEPESPLWNDDYRNRRQK